ncbi:NrfD/PsrC family molybdoenzyme membrane anchor subunit [Arabiibacter massiliensis]|uniref:NrfD/PsrC family molybdoenzyme membrane anchor subunit n=1 Tax=Arabiibacter massiliensis TaxID=1870985 RepID=UPI0009BB3711|nr:NrfD/PsrC family molybdoenzyme membrane anchor subunit [Arabiibacter massiliensis]
MFDSLITCYLFLGGAGGGALAILAVLEAVRAAWPRRTGLPDELFQRAWPLCAVTLGAGIVCLAADLGRFDRVLAFVVTPRPTPLVVGAYALAVALVCALAFSGLALLDNARPPRWARLALAALGLAAGLVTAAYTGVLLQGLASVLFWQTPLLPVVFTLSSLSCGVALALLAAAFVEARRPFVRPLSRLVRADGALIALEAACLAGYLALAAMDGGTAPAAFALLAGELAAPFWGGVAVAGLAVPFAMERLLTHGNHRSQLLWIAAFVLAGGFALRLCFVQAGLFDVTQMPEALFGLAAG